MRHPCLTLCLCACLLLALPGGAQGRVLSAGQGGDYPTIQEAVLHASPGDTVLVREGVYRERVEIGIPLVLQGEAQGSMPLVQAPPGAGGLVLSAGGVEVRGIAISCTGSGTGIRIEGDRARISGVYIRSCARGIEVLGSGASVTGSLIYGSTEYGVALLEGGSGTIARNTIRDGTGAGILVERLSPGNAVYLNNFMDREDAIVQDFTVSWVSPEPLAWVYGGRAWEAQPGNYWQDYAGSDTNGDGIGDTPYPFTGRGRGVGQVKGRSDPSPLVVRWEVLMGVPLQTVPPVSTPVPPTVTTTPVPTGTVVTTPATTLPPATTPATLPGVDGSEPDGTKGAGTSLRAVLLYLLLVFASGTSAWALSSRGRGTGAEAGKALPAVFCITAIPLLLVPLPLLERAMGPGQGSIGAVAVHALLSFLLLFAGASSLIQAGALWRGRYLRQLLLPQAVAVSLAVVLGAALWILQGWEAISATVVLLGALASAMLTAWTWHSLPGVTGEAAPVPSATVLPAGDRTRADGSVPGSFPPELRDRYSEIAYAGMGGIARVYRARRRQDNREVAVKVPVSFDEATGRSFLKEMRVWEELRHPNIVEVAGVNILPVPYVEMEFIPLSLDRVKKPLPVGEALRLVEGIAEGLAYAHTKGVAHRDLKPHNILLAEGRIPRIADWGLSGTIGRDATMTTEGFSLPYAAPEQLSPATYGQPGKATDIFQLGVILFELLTGVLPFRGSGLYETSRAIMSEEPAPLERFDPALAPLTPVVMKCLRKHPSERYRSVEEFLREIRRIRGASEGGQAGSDLPSTGS